MPAQSEFTLRSRGTSVAATDPADVVVIQNQLDALEDVLRQAGLAKNIEDIRPVNEARMKARHKLGELLKQIDRAQGTRTDLTSGGSPQKLPFIKYVKEILKITRDAAKEAERIGLLPPPDLEKALAAAREAGKAGLASQSSATVGEPAAVIVLLVQMNHPRGAW